MLTTGQRIRKLRKSMRLTQEKLADLCNVSHITVVYWELDRRLPNPDNLLRLSSLFGMSIETILKGSDQNE